MSLIETEEMCDIRHRREELDRAYKNLKYAAVEDFQKNPINTSLVGRYFQYGKKYFKILNVPQWDYSYDASFNEYQFPALMVDLSDLEPGIDPGATMYVGNGRPIAPGGLYHDERHPEAKEIKEEEFKQAICLFFEKYGVKGVF